MPTCRKCGVDQPVSGFYRKKGKPDLTWCKACYREWHRSRYTPRTGADDDPRPCRWCGVMYVPGNRRVSYFCSPACKYSAKHASESAALHAAKPDRSCLHCGREMSKTMRADAVFCGEKCNDAAHAVTRQMAVRARQAKPGQLLARGLIAARDEWVCGICGKSVDPTKSWPDPGYGSIDHVVPLAAGGSNDVENLQLAHLRCNLKKRQYG